MATDAAPRGAATWAAEAAPRAIPAGIYNAGLEFSQRAGDWGGTETTRAKLQTPPPIPSVPSALRARLPCGSPAKQVANAGADSAEIDTRNSAAAAMFFAEDPEDRGDRGESGTRPPPDLSPPAIELADLTVGAWDHSIVSDGFDPQAPPSYQFHPAAEPVRFVPDDAIRRTAYWSLLTRDRRLQASALQDGTPMYLIGELQTLHTDVEYETSGLSHRDRVGMMCRTLFNHVEIDYDRRRLETQVLSSDEWREMEWQRRAQAAAARAEGTEKKRRALRRSLAEYIQAEQGGAAAGEDDPPDPALPAGPGDARAAALESLDRLSDDQIARYARRFPRGKERFVCEIDDAGAAPFVPSVHWAPESTRGVKSLPRAARGACDGHAWTGTQSASPQRCSGDSGDSGGGGDWSPFDGLASTPVGGEGARMRGRPGERRWPRKRPGERGVLNPPIVQPSLGKFDGAVDSGGARRGGDRGAAAPQPLSPNRVGRLASRIPEAPLAREREQARGPFGRQTAQTLQEEQIPLAVSSTSADRPPGGPSSRPPSKLPQLSRFSPQRAPLAPKGGAIEGFWGQPQGVEGPEGAEGQDTSPVAALSLVGTSLGAPEGLRATTRPRRAGQPGRPERPASGKPGTPQSAGGPGLSLAPAVPQAPDLRVEDLEDTMGVRSGARLDPVAR